MPDSALAVLSTADPAKKAVAARAFRQAVLSRCCDTSGLAPNVPARPEKPDLVHPMKLAKRGMGTPAGRASLLHAIAHIELNAIDLAADMIVRFADAPEVADSRDDFVADWSSVCDDEARHFLMIQSRLADLGFRYGDFPAHNGLWDAAQQTAHDIAARLAIAPLVLEARGLDVTPGMIRKLNNVRDTESAAVLEVIYAEEVGHVAIGMKWFNFVAESRGEDPETYFHRLVKTHFRGRVKPPFNIEARTRAQFPASFYTQLAS